MAQHVVNDLPYLFVPTYPNDNGGNRPVPNGVNYHLCPGIQVLNTFKPGAALTVQLVIGNWQGASSHSIAFGALWWSAFSGGTIMPDPHKFIGVRTVPVGPQGSQMTTASMTAQIPHDAPQHFCLIAKVWHPLDLPIGEVADPQNDRHWAVRRLT
jgi:hypothetical protein